MFLTRLILVKIRGYVFFKIHFIVRIKIKSRNGQSVKDKVSIYKIHTLNKMGCDSVKVISMLLVGNVHVQTPLKCLIYT